MKKKKLLGKLKCNTCHVFLDVKYGMWDFQGAVMLFGERSFFVFLQTYESDTLLILQAFPGYGLPHF